MFSLISLLGLSTIVKTAEFTYNGLVYKNAKGFEEGESIEALASTPDETKLAFINARSLLQDTVDCNALCVRVSINDMSSIKNNGNASAVMETKEYFIEKSDKMSQISDLIILDNALKMGIILDRKLNDTEYPMDTILKLVDLSTGTDVKGMDAKKYSTQKLTTTDILKMSTIYTGNFRYYDALAYIDNNDAMRYCGGTGNYLIVATNDNERMVDTYFTFLCFNSVTKKLTKKKEEMILKNVTINSTPFAEISGLSFDSVSSTLYAVSDTLQFGTPKFKRRIFGLPLVITNTSVTINQAGITGIALSNPNSKTLSGAQRSIEIADIESVIYVSSQKKFILGIEGYRRFTTTAGYTEMWLYNMDGTYNSNVNYNTAVFQETGTAAKPTVVMTTTTTTTKPQDNSAVSIKYIAVLVLVIFSSLFV